MLTGRRGTALIHAVGAALISSVFRRLEESETAEETPCPR